MKSTKLLAVLIIQSNFLFGQDSCYVEVRNKYPDLVNRVTDVYEGDLLVKRYIKIGTNRLEILTWDGCGRLIQKQKNGYYFRRKTKTNKYLTMNYYTNGNIKTKRFLKTKGCRGIKKYWKKEYSEDGKSIKFEK